MFPHSTKNPFARESERLQPTDTDVVKALLGEKAAIHFDELASPQKEEIPPEADLPSGELALTEEEKARADANEREQTLEQQARTWFLDLGKDEDWIEKHFIFKNGITCIAEILNLSNCDIMELPSFFRGIKGIKSLNLNKNSFVALHNMPKEIGMHLYLSENPNLTSCAGLEGVTVGGSLSLFNNPNLASCTGLEGVIVGRDLYLNSNPSLTSCAGLEGITVGGNLRLDSNPKLASCVGLEGVTIKGSLYLSNNPKLTSLEGLPPKENIKDNLVFSWDQERLIREAREKEYKTLILT